MLSQENIDRINEMIESKLHNIEYPTSDFEEREATRRDLSVLVDLLREIPRETYCRYPSTEDTRE
jgi:hypothetical protein